MRSLKHLFILGMVFAFVFAIGTTAAKADTISLTIGNSAISGYAGPYGTVDIALVNSTHATITFTALSNGTNQFLFGAQGAIGLNINATNFSGSVSSFTSPAGFSAPSLSLGGAGNEDGFGGFNFTIDDGDSYTHAVRILTVSITNISGTWANAANVLTQNGSGYVAAAHILVAASTPPNVQVGALATGYAGNGEGPSVPEPSLLLLLGLGLGAVGSIAWRSKM